MARSDDSSLLERSEYENEVAFAKSRFYNDNFTPDNLKKVFNKYFTVDIDDIRRLNSMVVEKCKLHKNLGFIIDVNLRFSNRKQLHFGSWQEFESYNWEEEAASLISFVISWNLNVIFEGQNYPQKHKLIVKLSNGMRPEEMLNVIFSGDLNEVDELENNFFPVVAQVSFTNRTFGNELIDLVGKWVDQLSDPTYTLNRIMKFLKKRKVKISKIIEYSMIIISITGLIAISSSLISSYIYEGINISLKKQSLYNSFYCAGTSFLFAFLLIRVSRAVAESIYTTINDYGDIYIFNFTKQDKKKIGKLKKERKFAIIKLSTLIVFSVLSNIFFMFIDHFIFK